MPTSRRSFLGRTAAGSLAILPLVPEALDEQRPGPAPLVPPAHGPINVAFLISDGATVIDFTGPWEVFQDTMVPSRGESHDDQMPFRLYTVADGPAPVRATAGLRITPDYTVDDAPPPRVIVIPAMRASARVLDWLRKTSPSVDLTMSVCTGAFVLARTGLLAGKSATTHHDFFDSFAKEFKDVKLERGKRFVENGKLATAAGLTSGIDMALRAVERYFGPEVADRTARYMEYRSDRTESRS